MIAASAGVRSAKAHRSRESQNGTPAHLLRQADGQQRVLLASRLVLVALAAALPICAQRASPIEFFGGYSLSGVGRRETVTLDSAAAQPTRQLFHGAAFSISAKVNRRLRFVIGEVAWQTHDAGIDLRRYPTFGAISLPSNSSRLNYYQVLFGPEIMARREKCALFVRTLAGVAAEHLSTPSGDPESPHYVVMTDFGFAMGLGGGVEVPLSRRFTWRVGQFDYLPSHMGRQKFLIANPILTQLPSWQHNWRFQAGIVFHVGG